MGIPIYIFYYIYLAFVVFFLLYSLFNIYHLVKYGFLGIVTVVVVFFYISISIFILILTWNFTSQIDWQQVIPLSFGLSPSLTPAF